MVGTLSLVDRKLCKGHSIDRFLTLTRAGVLAPFLRRVNYTRQLEVLLQTGNVKEPRNNRRCVEPNTD
jgi:hypothetical protein